MEQRYDIPVELDILDAAVYDILSDMQDHQHYPIELMRELMNPSLIIFRLEWPAANLFFDDYLAEVRLRQKKQGLVQLVTVEHPLPSLSVLEAELIQTLGDNFELIENAREVVEYHSDLILVRKRVFATLLNELQRDGLMGTVARSAELLFHGSTLEASAFVADHVRRFANNVELPYELDTIQALDAATESDDQSNLLVEVKCPGRSAVVHSGESAKSTVGRIRLTTS